MPWPDPHGGNSPGPDATGSESPDAAASPLVPCRDSVGANTDLIRLVAAAADLCRKPLRHGVVLQSGGGPDEPQTLEVTLHLEARDPDGVRCPDQDLELEIYRSGSQLNLTLAWLNDDQRPMLWQGGHPVWMDGQGHRCLAPSDAAPVEALARRLRALLESMR